MPTSRFGRAMRATWPEFSLGPLLRPAFRISIGLLLLKVAQGQSQVNEEAWIYLTVIIGGSIGFGLLRFAWHWLQVPTLQRDEKVTALQAKVVEMERVTQHLQLPPVVADRVKPKARYTGEELKVRLDKIDEFISLIEKIRWGVRPYTDRDDVANDSHRMNRYLDWIQQWAWQHIPCCAAMLVPNSEPMTAGEVLRYHGWNLNSAALMAVIDRQLSKLREIKALLQESGKEDSQP